MINISKAQFIVIISDYKAIEKAIAPAFLHSYDAAVLKSSSQDWHQPIALIHDCLKVIPNYMDKAKEGIIHGFVQVYKGNPLARLANEMELSSEQFPRLTQEPEGLSVVLDSSTYMFYQKMLPLTYPLYNHQQREQNIR